jgi:hypothetical protein
MESPGHIAVADALRFTKQFCPCNDKDMPTKIVIAKKGRMICLQPFLIVCDSSRITPKFLRFPITKNYSMA